MSYELSFLGFFESETKLKMLHEIKSPLEQAVCVGDKSYLVENIGVMSQIPFPPAILV